MLLTSLMYSAVERALGGLLSLADNASFPDALRQKHLSLFISPLPVAFTLCFSEKLLVTREMQSFDQCAGVAGKDYCAVQMTLDSLPQLKDVQRLPQLMREGHLTFAGDIVIAQAFATWMDKLSIDWEEQLSSKIGDVPAHLAVSIFNSMKEQLYKIANLSYLQARHYVVEEERLLLSGQPFRAWRQEVEQLAKDTIAIESRMAFYDN